MFKMWKRICIAFLCLILLAPAAGLAKDYGDKDSAKVIWKTATMAPKGIGYSQLFEEILLPEIEAQTKGDLYLKIYWGGVMGDDKQILKKMRIDQLQGAGLSGQGTFELSNEIAVLGLPFMFNNYEEIDYVKTKMIDTFDAVVRDESGFKVLQWLDQDFDQIYSSKYPMDHCENFSKVRFITWYGNLEGRVLEKLGASPIPIDVAEIPSTVRSGAGEALIAPSIWIAATQLYNSFEYVNSAKIRYTPAFVVVTERAWNQVPPEHVKAVAKMRVPLSQTFCEHSRLESEKYLKAIMSRGIKCAQPCKEEMELLKAKTIPLWEELAGDLYSQEILDELLAHLQEFRNMQKGG
ncbi:TRAP transporter substrate-binding protein DctP [Desulfatibacillum aliphaticivorans]|uniref:TRAP transporter substrate-binding protein n=1 Tax=Desulfatibacillum aliphaticivorans TaxID=218208 RepID=UPI0004018E80|nr:TRAP transporter substrate-binding protein DctP [Desulfatibacillum aliphaticivorans]